MLHYVVPVNDETKRMIAGFMHFTMLSRASFIPYLCRQIICDDFTCWLFGQCWFVVMVLICACFALFLEATYVSSFSFRMVCETFATSFLALCARLLVSAVRSEILF